jgi:hypothetical protein
VSGRSHGYRRAADWPPTFTILHGSSRSIVSNA